MNLKAERQPTAQVKKVTIAHTDITAPAPEAIDSVNILKTDLSETALSGGERKYLF